MCLTGLEISMGMRASDIAGWTGGRVEGPDREFTGLEAMALALPVHVTFAHTTAYGKKLKECQAGGAIVTDGITVERRDEQTLVWVKNADLAVAAVLEQIAPPLPTPPVGVHPTAVVDPAAQLGKDVRIGEYVVIQAGAVIGDRTAIMAHGFVGAETVVGTDCLFWPNVTVRERCKVGARVMLHPGVVIGADGFGYRFANGKHVKIPQIGTVEIGDDVELGANTCVDRGKFSATVVGAGSKLDNLVQIGHNVRLGRHSILVSHTAIGGSTMAGDYLLMGGAAVMADHVTVGAGVQVAGMSAVTRDFGDQEKLAGVPAAPATEAFALYRAQHQTPKLIETVRELQKRIAKLEAEKSADTPGA